ncbi:hypothetical protein CQ10_39890 [Bradyrhizobium valentinum]|nr:hypothetical protein CQ10_39890 [Bradyrhizobium valentinum]
MQIATLASIVQKIEELFDLPKRSSLASVADVDDPIAIALQGSRPGFPKSSRQECRGYGIQADIKSYDSSSPAVDP